MVDQDGLVGELDWLREPETVLLIDRMRLAGVGLKVEVAEVDGCFVVTKGRLPAWLAAPEGRVVRQRCRNALCLRDSHMAWIEVTTDALEREWQRWHRSDVAPPPKRSDRCGRGHEWTEENTYRSSSGRQCRTCKRAQAKESRRRKAAAPVEVEPVPAMTAEDWVWAEKNSTVRRDPILAEEWPESPPPVAADDSVQRVA